MLEMSVSVPVSVCAVCFAGVRSEKMKVRTSL